jgi:hypothetical protein
VRVYYINVDKEIDWKEVNLTKNYVMISDTMRNKIG